MIESCCHVCGFSEKDLAKTFRLGCSACYGVFEVELRTMIPKVQTRLLHVGKRPAEKAISSKLRRELREIETLLSKHVYLPIDADNLLDRWREVSSQIAACERSQPDSSCESS